jgi:hypothetical protein
MINSFYFIALASNRLIDLDWGVVVCCQLVKPIVTNETFSHTVFFGQLRTLSHQSSTNMILTALSKLRIYNQEQIIVSKLVTSCGLGSTLLLKIVALQLVTYQSLW